MGKESKSNLIQISLLEAIFNNTLVATIIGLTDGSIIEANEAACSMLGYTKEELIKIGRNGICISDAAQENYLYLRRISGQAQGILNYKRKNGEIFKAKVHSTIIRDYLNTEYSCVTIVDLSYQKKLENEVFQKNNDLTKILESSLDFISVIDKNGNRKYISESANAIFGYAPSELIGLPIYKLVHPEDKDFTEATILSLEIVKKVKNYRNRIIHKDGHIVNMLWNYNYDEESGHIYMFGRDITSILEKKKASLKEELSLQHLVNEIEIGIIKFGKDAEIYFSNKAALDIFGVTHSQQLSMNAFIQPWQTVDNKGKLITLENDPVRMAFISGNTIKKAVAELIHPITRKHHWITVNAVPKLDDAEHPDHVICTFVDITEKKKSTDHLLKLNRDLEKQKKIIEEKNTELEKFAYIAAHDLQSPLRVISSALGIMEKTASQLMDDETKKLLHYTLESAEKMKLLIRDILDFSKAGNTITEKEEINMNELVNEVTKLLCNGDLEQDRTFIVSPLPVIIGIKTLIFQLLQNLISNALKYNTSQQPVVEISAKKSEKEWIFSIKDNGIGIDAKNFEKVFQLFQRLHRSDEYAGTGIGLSLCKKIVENHGGTIWVESEPGKGSNFFFSIPAI